MNRRLAPTGVLVAISIVAVSGQARDRIQRAETAPLEGVPKHVTGNVPPGAEAGED